MNRAQVAKAVRENKEKHPERFCTAKNCLWNTSKSPCKKHPYAPISLGRVVAGETVDPMQPDFTEEVA